MSKNHASNFLEKNPNLFTLENQFITPHGYSLPFPAYNKTSQKRIEGALTRSENPHPQSSRLKAGTYA